MKNLDFAPGYKTYLAAVGMLAGAAYFAFAANPPDYGRAYELLLGALAAFGLRQASDRTKPVVAILALLLVGAGPAAASEFQIRPGFVVTSAAVAKLPEVETQATYATQLDRCAIESRPLLVGVRCDAPTGAWLTTRIDDDTLGEGNFVAIIKPRAGRALYVGTMRPDVTARQCKTALTVQPGCECGLECVCSQCRCESAPRIAPPAATLPAGISVMRRAAGC